MKIQVRNSCYETNSSSTHAFTMMSEEVFDKWKLGEIEFVDLVKGEPCPDMTREKYEEIRDGDDWDSISNIDTWESFNDNCSIGQDDYDGCFQHIEPMRKGGMVAFPYKRGC